jgi:peptidoglycan/xylan/chitin deacetylase (PgdA/CDA1 family)
MKILVGFFMCVAFLSIAMEAIASDNPKILFNGDRKGQRSVAITIDDCAVKKNVEKMLDIAEKHGIKLTFFPTGMNVLAQPDLWRKIRSLGHQIELHTQNHKSLVASVETQAREIISNIASIRKVLKEELKFSFLRPPFGAGVEGENKKRMQEAIKKASEYNGKSMNIAMWDVDLMFRAGKLTSADQIRDLFKNNLLPGSVFLFHARGEDVIHFEEMVIHAKEKGYSMVTMDDLFSSQFRPEEIFIIPEAIFRNKTLLAEVSFERFQRFSYVEIKPFTISKELIKEALP